MPQQSAEAVVPNLSVTPDAGFGAGRGPKAVSAATSYQHYEQCIEAIELIDWETTLIPHCIPSVNIDKQVVWSKEFDYYKYQKQLKQVTRKPLLSKMPPPYLIPFPPDTAYGPKPLQDAPTWLQLKWECAKYIDRLFLTTFIHTTELKIDSQ